MSCGRLGWHDGRRRYSGRTQTPRLRDCAAAGAAGGVAVADYEVVEIVAVAAASASLRPLTNRTRRCPPTMLATVGGHRRLPWRSLRRRYRYCSRIRPSWLPFRSFCVPKIMFRLV